MTRALNVRITFPLATLLALGACAHAPPRPNDTVPFAPLARPSYFWAMWPHDAMYEGDVNIPVPLRSRTAAITYPDQETVRRGICPDLSLGAGLNALGRAIRKDGQPKPRNTGCTFSFTPHFVIRQLSGGSAPVRTPTFNPGFEYIRFDLSLEDSARATARHAERGGPSRTATLRASHLRFGHYSNGQAGCLYTNQFGEDCRTDLNRPEEPNKLDGSFSTHYLEMGSSISRVHYGEDSTERRMTTGTAAIRVNPDWLAPIGGMNDELARTYGRWSLSGGLSTRVRSRKVVTTLSVEGECAFLRPDGYQPCRVSGGAAVSFQALYGAGIALRWVDGWDYYNVGYGDRMRNSGGWRPMLGILIDHSIPMRIRGNDGS